MSDLGAEVAREPNSEGEMSRPPSNEESMAAQADGLREMHGARRRGPYLLGLGIGIALGVGLVTASSRFARSDEYSAPAFVPSQATSRGANEQLIGAAVGSVDDEPGVVGFLTRISIDRERGVVRLAREPFFAKTDEAFAVRAALWSDSEDVIEAGKSEICIPDVFDADEVEHRDHRWSIGGHDVRIALRLWGPPKGETPAGNTAVECVVWVDGMTRVVGHLADTLPEVQNATVFQMLSVFLQGRVLVATACRRSDGEWRLSTVNGNLGTQEAWMITGDDFFAEPEDEPSAATDCVRDVERMAEPRVTDYDV